MEIVLNWFKHSEDWLPVPVCVQVGLSPPLSDELVISGVQGLFGDIITLILLNQCEFTRMILLSGLQAVQVNAAGKSGGVELGGMPAGLPMFIHD
jgi:hypothetical protein